MFLNIKQSGDEIHIKGSKIHYVALILFVVGGLLSSIYLILEGLTFSSTFSLLWLVGGMIFLPIFSYLFIWFSPGLIPAKTIVSLVPGPSGYIQTKKGNVSFKNIQGAELRRNGFTLVNSLVITTHDHKQYRVPAYGLIGENDVNVLVDQYIYPHMIESAKEAWNTKIDLDKLYEDTKYKRKDNIYM
ncbi:DUF5381 family protein [Priestia flexa]|jgi:Family of unknown function (DUF5381)|uniref:DUF5381 family protein n=1 Tax=Priestia flexa TaxID=86664 RepID=UPI0011A2EB60|nr:DUF5381 family protein [Priestia flexa]MED3822461.1 DUF5381 family protein [Priestia flexa]